MNKRADDLFFSAHADSAEELGYDFLEASGRVTQVLRSFGYDVSDRDVRAIASAATRATLSEKWTAKILDKVLLSK